MSYSSSAADYSPVRPTPRALFFTVDSVVCNSNERLIKYFFECVVFFSNIQKLCNPKRKLHNHYIIINKI